jgi:hypothetical protein
MTCSLKAGGVAAETPHIWILSVTHKEQEKEVRSCSLRSVARDLANCKLHIVGVQEVA